MKTALVCWIGGNDLRAGRESDLSSPGPILTTLNDQPHEWLHLLSNSQAGEGEYSSESVAAYVDWLQSQVDVKVEIHDVALESPVHYGDIYTAARATLSRLVEQEGATNVTVLLSPGTPSMHAVWLLLCKTSYRVQMLQSSKEAGVQEVDAPFDISADYVPALLSETSKSLAEIAAGDPSVASAFEGILSESAVLKEQVRKAQIMAVRDVPVLILGESGTGKELFAKAVHDASARRDRALITVNCGAIPPELVDSHLFGHVKGAFTGAIKSQSGMFDEADGGSIFLDEFGELPADTQVRLLRVLQDGTFNRVGDTSPRKVDVRVIAATNRDLHKEMAEWRFREDLYYRVAVGILELPPLRDRGRDLMLLSDRILAMVNEKAATIDSSYQGKKLSAGARNVIKSHGWPGNIRELQASLTRASLWSTRQTITERDMKTALLVRPAGRDGLLGRSLDESFKIQEVIDEVERHYVTRALEETAGNKTRAASKLGLKSQQVLSNRMKRLGLA